MAIIYVLLAGLLASISNFCLRRSIDAGGSSKAYLAVQVTFSFFFMILLNPVRTNNYTFDTSAVVLGLVGGIIFGVLMWSLGKSLEKGPAGLTFAVLNASTVAPAIVLVLLFGPAFGQGYTWQNALGSFLVVVGLFWAGYSSEKQKNKGVWISFVTLLFALHALFLIYLQWWAMLLNPKLPASLLLPFNVNTNGVQWFMPAILLVGALTQLILFLSKERRIPKRAEVAYGIIGGITNGACTFFLILAPQVAAGWENAMIFPIFSVSIIIICNIWAQILYKEKVNWMANALCVGGLLVGTIVWSGLLT